MFANPVAFVSCGLPNQNIHVTSPIGSHWSPAMPARQQSAAAVGPKEANEYSLACSLARLKSHYEESISYFVKMVVLRRLNLVLR